MPQFRDIRAEASPHTICMKMIGAYMSEQASKTLPNIPCVILAAGQSRRFGSNKALAHFRGERLIDRLIKQLESQIAGPIAINSGETAISMASDKSIIIDQFPSGVGPLAGIHAAMIWAQSLGHEFVVTTPVDTPLIPDDFIDRLSASGAPSVARDIDRVHGVHGIWPVNLAQDFARQLSLNMRSVRAWVAHCGARECLFPKSSGVEPFFNINTPEDLKRLEDVDTVSLQRD